MGHCCSTEVTKRNEILCNTIEGNHSEGALEEEKILRMITFQENLELHQMKCLTILKENNQDIKTMTFTPSCRFDDPISTEISVSAEPISSVFGKVQVQGQLSQEHNSITSPVNCQGLVPVRDPEKSKFFWGAGVLIGPNLVLTPAKNIFNEQILAEYNEIMFSPGVCNMHAPFGTIDVIQVYYPESYKTNKIEDYALLVLSSPVGTLAGYCGLHVTDFSSLKVGLQLIGYPFMLLQKSHSEGLFESSSVNVFAEKANNDLLKYHSPLTGIVGSALYYHTGKEFFIVGIGCSEKHAVWITGKRFQQIKIWVEDAINKVYLGNDGKDWDRILKIDRTSKNLQDYGASILSGCPLNRLKQLFLKNNVIGDVGAACLGKNSTWTSLTYLDLEKNQIGKQGISRLISASWTALNTLKFGSNKFGDEGVIELAKNMTWKNLEILNLYQNEIGEYGANGLAVNVSWSNLKVLDLTGNKIQDKGAAELAKNSSWKQLQTLILERNDIRGEGLYGLCQNLSWHNLEVLILNSNKTENQGMAALANSIWHKLQRLELNNNSITEEGVRHLALNTSWIDLRILYLDDNNMGDGGVRDICINPNGRIWLSSIFVTTRLVMKELLGYRDVKLGKT